MKHQMHEETGIHPYEAEHWSLSSKRDELWQVIWKPMMVHLRYPQYLHPECLLFFFSPRDLAQEQTSSFHVHLAHI